MVRPGSAIDEELSWIGNRGLEELDEKPLFDTYRSQGRTHLHIAAERGDLEVVRNILSRRPELSTEVDLNGASPLHLASVNGHLEVVRHLLNVNQSICLLQDNNGNTPLHMTADRGQIEVAKVLISQLQPGEFIGEIKPTRNLQRCVIRCGPEALQQIIQADPNFLNGCDNEDHNTLLHTAAFLNNLEMVRYLVRRNDMWIAKNKKSLSALDMVKISSKGPDVNNDTKEILTLLKRHTDEWEHKSVNFFEKKWNAIQVAASVIASLAFQAGLNPPGGVFQEDKRNPNGDLISPMGTSVIAFTNPYRYVMFLIVNTLAFVSSICIVVLLISRIHLKQTVYMWLVTVGMWSTITAMEYFDTVHFTTLMKAPRFDKNLLILLLCKPFSVCLGLTTTLLLLHTDPYTKFFKKIVSYAYGVLRNNARLPAVVVVVLPAVVLVLAVDGCGGDGRW